MMLQWAAESAKAKSAGAKKAVMSMAGNYEQMLDAHLTSLKSTRDTLENKSLEDLDINEKFAEANFQNTGRRKLAEAPRKKLAKHLRNLGFSGVRNCRTVSISRKKNPYGLNSRHTTSVSLDFWSTRCAIHTLFATLDPILGKVAR